MTGNTRQAGRMFWCKRQPGHERSKHNMSKIASHNLIANWAIIHVLHTNWHNRYTLSTEFSSLVPLVAKCHIQEKHLKFKSSYSARSTAQTVDTFVFFKGLARMSKSVTDPGLLSPSSCKFKSKVCVASWVWVSTTVSLAGARGTYNKRTL